MIIVSSRKNKTAKDVIRHANMVKRDGMVVLVETGSDYTGLVNYPAEMYINQKRNYKDEYTLSKCY